jgi:hypothetical protein
VGAGVFCAACAGVAFYIVSNCGGKKGGVNELGKLRSNFDFTVFVVAAVYRLLWAGTI